MDIELYEVNDGIEKPISELDFGQAIVGRDSIKKSFMIKTNTNVEDLCLIVKSLDRSKMLMSIQNQAIYEGDEVLLADNVHAGQDVKFDIEVTPIEGGFFSPQLELKYLIMPRRD